MSTHSQPPSQALQAQALFELTRTGASAAAAELSSLAERHLRIPAHACLHHQGEPPRRLYVVTQGLIKTHVQSEGGGEQVCAFQGPGGLIGLDALRHERHTSSATAITPSRADALSLQRLRNAMQRDARWASCLLECTTQALAEAQESLILLGSKGGEARVATFLLIQSLRAGRGAPRTHFHLHMTRTDMANYLGLTKESTCRLLARLQRRELIRLHCKAVTIRDVAGLAGAGGVGSLASRRRAA